MRDFLPDEARRRAYVIGAIREVYERYGFEPLETPAVENIETLLGKYGEEGNQLIFKILKRGEHEATGQADLALRYDLTVPLARVVAEYRAKLPRYFKRYQVQPVWRADRPARGRFREFYQCDVDVLGSTSPVVEAELCAAASEALARLGFQDFEVRLNHRGLLTALLLASGVETARHGDALVALDKLDKIGRERVAAEMTSRGVAQDGAMRLLDLFAAVGSDARGGAGRSAAAEKGSAGAEAPAATGEAPAEAPAAMGGEGLIATGSDGPAATDAEDVPAATTGGRGRAGASAPAAALAVFNARVLETLRQFVGETDGGRAALDTLRRILALVEATPASGRVRIDPSLARGLSYYTGAIMEIAVPDLAGSLGGGGRYDNLVGMFLGQDVPAAGISLGLERIIVVMTERGMFPPEFGAAPADLMVAQWNEATADQALGLAHELRAAGLRVDVYPEADKIGKQFKYAAGRGVAAVAVMGDDELARGEVTVKDLRTGQQTSVARRAAAAHVRGLVGTRT